MIYSSLQVGALILTLEAAFFLARASIVLDARSIAQLSRTTHQGYNTRLVHSLAQQTADSRIGVLLLVAAFAVQIAAQWRGPFISDIGPADLTGAAIAIVMSLLVFGASSVSSKLYASRIEGEAAEILTASTKDPTPQTRPQSE